MIQKIGLFETFLCVGRRAPLLERHWARLRRSSARLDIPLRAEVRRDVNERIGRLEMHPHRARLDLAADGSADLTIRAYDPACRNQVHPPAERLTLAEAPTGYPGKWAGHKTAARRDLDRLHAAAQRAGAADALLVTRDLPAVVLETACGNIFWIRNDVVYTPASSLGCLPGIARGWVIRHLRRWGISVRQGRFTLCELARADAVLRTNALIGVRRVVEIGGLKKWAAPKHPIAARLWRAWRILCNGTRPVNFIS